MSTATSSRFALTPEAFWRWGHALLVAGLGFGLLIVALVAWKAPQAAPFLPLILIGLSAGAYLFQRPTLNLYVALAGFVLIAGYGSGIQIQEVFYGLYFLAVLAHWYIRHLVFYRERLAHTPEDWALLLFLLYAAASVGWAVLFGAKPRVIMGEALVLVMLAFYFPVKEICSRSPHGVYVVLGIIFWFAVFASVRNLLQYRAGLQSAVYLYQIATGRVALNEVLLMMPALAMLVLLLYARRWLVRFALLVGFLVSFIGLILTQSRGYWVAFLFGALALFVFTDRRRKGQILLLMGGGLVVGLGLGLLLFEDSMTLIITGVVDRFASLGMALTSDLSLVNRYYETLALWEWIKVNPILGYGMGTPYHYFNLTTDATRAWAFVHNGFAGLWYKFGLVGLGLMLTFWGRAIWNGLRLFRALDAPRLLRLTGLIVAVCLIAELLVANTSNPFLIADATLMIALLGALASGGRAYVQRHTAAPEATR